MRVGPLHPVQFGLQRQVRNLAVLPVGRKLLYPRNFGDITSGSANIVAEGVGYHALRIQGYAYGAHGRDDRAVQQRRRLRLSQRRHRDAVSARQIKTKCRVPIMTGALGSTFIAAKYWDSFAIGAALCGFPIVVGENVVGIDKQAEIDNGARSAAPELDRRIDTFLRYYDGYGAIIVQMNVEDTRNGVAEYLIDKYGDKVIIELKWGQGAKDIGGEIQVTDIEYASFLKDRGYVVDPDPYDPMVRKGLRSACHHHLCPAQPPGRHRHETAPIRCERRSWRKSIDLRALGLQANLAEDRLLRHGSAGHGHPLCGRRQAGPADDRRFGRRNRHEPLEHDGPLGRAVAALHAKTYEYCKVLADRGITPPDISLAGGFAREDHIFKAIALCAPYTKLICMGRAPMIPGFLGSNIEGVFKPEQRAASLRTLGRAAAVGQGHRQHIPEEIFCRLGSRREKVGDDEMDNIPFGAIAMYGYADKLGCGLQQFMAGARKFTLDQIDRADLMAANRETAELTGIPFMTDAQNEEALAILNK